MPRKYNPHKIEAKWQAAWPTHRDSYELKPGDEPFYCLDMFSYPSSEGLHMGHWRPYTVADVIARFQTMRGKKVLHPVGFDAFGLPAENAAIKNKTHPAAYTEKSIANFTRQLKQTGVMYDWSTLTITSSPEYYKWTQWIFLQLFKHGLAYRKLAPVNWCPKDQTVLANEQVIGGKCERCGTEVTKKELKQWFFKITDFAEDLLQFEGLQWPDRIKTLQTNWIGKSEGAEIKFDIVSESENKNTSSISVFTTRPDTLMGVTYIVLAPEHPLVKALTTAEQQANVHEYIDQAKKTTEIERLAEDREKTGVFSGSYAIHPLSGEKLPIWIADYVLASYGTGAVMAVPAHDTRDYAFAKKYQLPIKQVIEPVYIQSTEPGKVVEGLEFDHRDAIIAIVKHWAEDKYIALKWKNVAWGTLVTGGIEGNQTAVEAAISEIREETGYLHPKLIKDLGMIHSKFYHVPKKVNRFAHSQMLYFELQDKAQNEVAASETAQHEVLWLTKQEIEKFLTPDTHLHVLRRLFGEEVYTGEGILTNSGQFDGLSSTKAKTAIISHLASEHKGGAQTQYRLHDWLISRQRYWGPPIPMVYCEACGEQPVPDDQLPVLLPEDVEFTPGGDSPLARHDSFKLTKCPQCGGQATRDTDTLDTFVDSSWYYLRYTSPHNLEAAFDQEQVKAWLPVDFYIGGTEHATLHLLYARFISKALHKIGLIPYAEPFQTFYGNGMVYLHGSKMSKSKGNVVNPDEMVKQYGTDALRGYILFMGPADQDVEWQTGGINGVSRFLDRAWQLLLKTDRTKTTDAIAQPIQQSYGQVTELLNSYHFNRCISSLMTAVNALEKQVLTTNEAEILTQLFAPFFPHFAEEVWQELGHDTSIFSSHWPELTIEVSPEVTYAIQVNGRVKTTLTVSKSISETDITIQAQSQVAPHIADKKVQKTVFVPGRIVNFVVK